MNSDNIRKKAYNESLKNVERVNKELDTIYTKAKVNILNKIAVLKMKAENGLLNEFEKLRLKRLNSFIDSLTKDITNIKLEESAIIVNGYVDNYTSSYYANAYATEYEVNTRLLRYEPYGYTIYTKQLNKSYIMLSYNENVASQVFGMTMKEKTKQDILVIQKKIRQAVTQAIAEGISPKKLAKRFKDMNIIFEQSKNHAKTVARTEMLRGYSYGNQQSIDEAVDAGVEGVSVWDSTLDGRTRPAHQRADQQRAINGYFTVDGQKTKFPRDAVMSAKNSVNCRCVSVFEIEGLEPNSRGYRSKDGKWEKTNKNMNYEEWAESLNGKESIEAQRKKDKARRKRLDKRLVNR